MTSLLHYTGKLWLEFWGRRRPTVRYTFPDDQIITQGIPMKVWAWTNACYINLHPTHYAVTIAPDGRMIHLRGGYNFPLPSGHHTLHYIDKQNRVHVMPRVSETTRDGSQVSLDLVITYRVIDPIRALEVQDAVHTLWVFINSDLKEFIRSHNYDEIVGDGSGRGINSLLLSNYLKDQHAGRHQMSRLFLIADIVVEEQVGDPKLREIRQNFQREQRQNTAKNLLFKQKQELETQVASLAAELQQIRAQADARQQTIQQELQGKNIELEGARAQLKYRQDIMQRAMDAIEKAFSASAYPMDPREVEIIKEIIGELRGTPLPAGEAEGRKENGSPNPAAAEDPDRLNTLTQTLLKWQDYKRS